MFLTVLPYVLYSLAQCKRKLERLSVSFLRDTWGRVKIDGCKCVCMPVCVWLYVQPRPGELMLCVVSMTTASFSLPLYVSHPLSVHFSLACSLW